MSLLLGLLRNDLISAGDGFAIMDYTHQNKLGKTSCS